MSSISTFLYAALAFAAGAFIPVMATMNGAIGRSIGGPGYAALILFVIGLAALAGFVLLSGAKLPSLAQLSEQPLPYYSGGLVMAFYVLSITFLTPRFGVGNAILFVVTAQIISSALIDHFALFGAPHRPIGWLRAAGLAVMIAGVAITQQSRGEAKT